MERLFSQQNIDGDSVLWCVLLVNFMLHDLKTFSDNIYAEDTSLWKHFQKSKWLEPYTDLSSDLALKASQLHSTRFLMSIGTKVQFRLLLQLIYDSLLKHASKVVGSFSYSRKYLTPVMLYLYKCHTKNGVLLQYLGWSRLILIIHYAVSFSRIHHRLLLSLTRKVW